MLSNSPYLQPQYYQQEQLQYIHPASSTRGLELPSSYSSSNRPGFSKITPLTQPQQRSFAGYSTASSLGNAFSPFSSQNTAPIREERFIQGSQYPRESQMLRQEVSSSDWYPIGRREIIIQNDPIPISVSNNYESERVVIERPISYITQERFVPSSGVPPPPPMVPSQRILTPSVPVVSWHPLNVSKIKLNSQQKQQNQSKENQEKAGEIIQENEEVSIDQAISNNNLNNNSNSSNQFKSASQIRSSHQINNSSYQNTDSDNGSEEEEEDSRKHRFEELFYFERINQKHDNLFQKEFKKDKKMKDVFKQRGDTAQFDLGNAKFQIVPSTIWHNIDNQGQKNLNGEGLYDNDISMDSYEEYETTTTTTMRNKLWDVRFNKLDEADYLVYSSHNMFARKSNYLRLGLFYKQAFIKYQFDKKKDICYYMYSYDEYSVRKKQSEIDQEAEQEEHRIASLSQFDDQTGNSFDDPTSINDFNDKQPFQVNASKISIAQQDQQQQNSKQNLATNKLTLWTLASKQNILQQSSSQLSNPLKSKVITMTTMNKSMTIKTKVQDQLDFKKSSYMRDYENTFLQNESAIAEENESKILNRSMNSSSEQQIDITGNSVNYKKLFQSKPAKERKTVIEKKQDDLSKIKARHNKFELWEKSATSEDAFLDQVRDSTIEAVKRARNLEQIIVEKNSVFEHHAASLLHQHVFQLRKVSREYKAQLYTKVKEIIQVIYDEYREAINFESNNTFVMLVCDRADNDRILGVHYHGYQSRRYFEKHFDEFVTYSKTKQEFEQKRYQALLIPESDNKICKRYFIKE